jgi:DNA-binding transcriptional regulator YiaG
MIHAYDKLYLEKARTSLARMFDFAVNDLKFEISNFFELFLISGYADLFGKGDIRTIAGCSGIELTYTVLDKCNISYKRITPGNIVDRSREYWTGWALAYYQFYSGLSFASIEKQVPISDIVAMYNPYHEMDIHQFVDRMNLLIHANRQEANLKRLRMYAQLSQSELARKSEIPLRTIQQYEQRQKNINKAGADYVITLARVLGCNAEDLLENQTDQ